MRAIAVISRYFIPKEDTCSAPSHVLSIVGEKGDISMLGFTGASLFEKKILGLPEDYIRNWLSHVLPTTKDECGDIVQLPPSNLLISYDNSDEPVPGEI